MIDKSELLDDLRRVAEEVGHPPTRIEYDDSGEYSYQTLINRFGDAHPIGGWTAVLREAGMNPGDRGDV